MGNGIVPILIPNMSRKIGNCIIWPRTYCKDDRDASLSSSYVNMIGLLAEFVTASNSFKIVLRYFDKV